MSKYIWKYSPAAESKQTGIKCQRYVSNFNISVIEGILEVLSITCEPKQFK